MKQKIWLLRNDTKRRLSVPFKDADHAICEDGACDQCGSINFGVQGMGKRPSKDDLAWEADALTTCCKQPCGVIRVEMNTLFGVREDRAVLEGRVRVY